MGVPLAPVSNMPTLVVPVVVVPAAGLVNDPTRGGGVPPPLFWTFSVIEPLPLLPAGSVTLTVAV